MKKSLIAILALAAAAAASAQTFSDIANVRRVTPQYQQVGVDHEICETRMVTTEASQPSAMNGGTIIGGIAGGLLGAQVGKGNGKVAAAAIGAATGALVGNSMNNAGTPQVATTQPVKQCHIETRYEQRVNGYLVDYDYQGRGYSAVMPNDPGTTIRVNVSVSPAVR